MFYYSFYTNGFWVIQVQFEILFYQPEESQNKIYCIHSNYSIFVVGWIGAMRSVYRTGVGELVGYNSTSAWDAIMVNLEVFKMLCIHTAFDIYHTFSFGMDYIERLFSLSPLLFPMKANVISAIVDQLMRQ